MQTNRPPFRFVGSGPLEDQSPLARMQLGPWKELQACELNTFEDTSGLTWFAQFSPAAGAFGSLFGLGAFDLKLLGEALAGHHVGLLLVGLEQKQLTCARQIQLGSPQIHSDKHITWKWMAPTEESSLPRGHAIHFHVMCSSEYTLPPTPPMTQVGPSSWVFHQTTT